MTSVFISNLILAGVSATVIVLSIEVIATRFRFRRIQSVIDRMALRMSTLGSAAGEIRRAEGGDYHALPDRLRVAYRTVMGMYGRHLSRDVDVKQALIARASLASGEKFSVYDLYAALEQGRVNRFVITLIDRDPNALVDYVRLAVFKSEGFDEEYRLLARRLRAHDPRCPGGRC